MSEASPDPVVFVVDDDEAVRDSLAIMLEAEGFTVEAHASGRAFLEQLVPERKGCVVADVRMPDMDGLELLERLMARGGGSAGALLPVIIITGHGDVPMAVRAMKAGAVDFIEKPFTPEVIVEIVRRALGAGRPGPAGTAAAAVETDGVAARLAQLTPREAEVLEQLVIGRSNKVIAHEPGISLRTVEIHRARVMEKMGARSLSHLVRMALAAGVNPRTSYGWHSRTACGGAAPRAT